MTIAASTDMRQAFIDAVRKQEKLKQEPKVQAWRKRLVTDTENLRCNLCGKQINRGDVSGDRQIARILPIVPARLGGPTDNDNLIAACHTCAKSTGKTDLLTWPEAMAKHDRIAPLLKRRMEILQWSHNHLLRNNDLGKKKATVLRHLERRWTSPRVLVRAAHTGERAWIAFSAFDGVPDDLVAMVRSMGGRPVAPHIFEMPAFKFFDAVWALIDHNALVRRIDLPVVAITDAESSIDDRWHVTLPSVLDIRRGRPKIKPVRRPVIERPMDWGQRLLIEYQASSEQGRPFDWEWINSHKETDAQWTRERQAQARRQSAELSRALEMIPDHSAQGMLEKLDRSLAQRVKQPGAEDALARLARDHGIEMADAQA